VKKNSESPCKRRETSSEFEGLIQQAFREDFAFEDITSLACIEPDRQAVGELVLKQEGVIAGLPFLPLIFQQRDPAILVELFACDGETHAKGTMLGRLVGPARSLLSAERTALNLLQHLSGIATLTARCVAKVQGTKCQILDTRKTLPGYRELQKYAVRMGGGTNHRHHLADRILIKNNHLALVPLSTCIERARSRFPGQFIEVEISSPAEMALTRGADAILLDNMSPKEVRRCVEWNGGKIFLEASGGIGLEQVEEYAKTGVNGISMGALTHSAPALDLSFRIKEKL
jgi:nicotinate-nucleotide pyrophosphorylase (carboxylating)